ncbi:MAG: type II toxin-antitoxin system VapC family toxin [Verrucomicrobia bacterium]|nr:type II toxin-antitoxin system VapC family toxin [Verrucomicrobiota bacterium]
MRVYIDTNLLVRLYLNLDGTGQAHELLFQKEIKTTWPLLVTDLLACEFTNALQRLVYESKHTGQWRVTPESAMASQGFFNDHLEQQTFLIHSPLTLADVKPKFKKLSQRHTAKHGFRTYDMLHVASALTLQCTHFFSFDKKVNQLAKLEGLLAQ